MIHHEQPPKIALPADILMLHGAIEERLRSDGEVVHTEPETGPQFHSRDITELIPPSGLQRLAVKWGVNRALIRQEAITDHGATSEVYGISIPPDTAAVISQSIWDKKSAERSIDLATLKDILNLEDTIPVAQAVCHALSEAIKQSRVHPIQPNSRDSEY